MISSMNSFINSSMNDVSRLRGGLFRNRDRGKKFVSSLMVSKPTLRHTQPPIQRVPVVLRKGKAAGT